MRRHRSSWSHCSDWRPERTQRSSRLGATLPAEVAGAMWRMRMERGAARSTGSLMVTPSGSLLLISPFKLFPPPFLDSFSFSPPFFLFLLLFFRPPYSFDTSLFSLYFFFPSRFILFSPFCLPPLNIPFLLCIHFKPSCPPFCSLISDISLFHFFPPVMLFIPSLLNRQSCVSVASFDFFVWSLNFSCSCLHTANSDSCHCFLPCLSE